MRLENVKTSNVSWKRSENDPNRFSVEVVFAIENKGRVIAKYPFLFAQINPAYNFTEYGLDGNGYIGLKKLSGTKYWRKYSGGTDIVVYPNVFLEVDKIRGEFLFLHMDHFYDLILEFELIAENMDLMKKKIILSKEDIINPDNYKSL